MTSLHIFYFLFSCVPTDQCKGSDLVVPRGDDFGISPEDLKAYIVAEAEIAECDNSNEVCCNLDNKMPIIESKCNDL